MTAGGLFCSLELFSRVAEMSTLPCSDIRSNASGLEQCIWFGVNLVQLGVFKSFPKLGPDVVCRLNNVDRSLWKRFSTATSTPSQRSDCKAPFGTSSVVFPVLHASSQVRHKDCLAHHKKARIRRRSPTARTMSIHKLCKPDGDACMRLKW